MSAMFAWARSFNQDLSNWDVRNVTEMDYMFEDASNFTDQDLSGWNVSKVTTHVLFFNGAGPGNIEPNWPSAASFTNEDFDNTDPGNTEAGQSGAPE
jgi:surface protein